MNIVNSPSPSPLKRIKNGLNEAQAVAMYVPRSYFEQYKSVHTDEQFYFVHLLCKRILENKVKHFEFQSLKIEYLSRQLGSMPRERQIQKLIDEEVVEVRSSTTSGESYRTGSRSKAYRLTDTYRSEIIQDILIGYWAEKGSTLSRRLNRNRKRICELGIAAYPILTREFGWLKKIKFDTNRADSLQEKFETTGKRGLKTYNRYSAIRFEIDKHALSHLHLGDFYFNYNGVRLTTPVTNTMKELRGCLKDEFGNYFIEVDLRSSQLVFLCKAVQVCIDNKITSDYYKHLNEYVRANINVGISAENRHDDIGAFIRHVITGDFYKELYQLEQLYQRTWKNENTYLQSKSSFITDRKEFKAIRSQFKEAVLKEIIFNYHTRKKNVPSLVDAFGESYPQTLSLIKGLAQESNGRKKSANLARITQSYEAFFFHEYALNLLEEKFPQRTFYVVHDSIGIPGDIITEGSILLNKALYSHLQISEDFNLLKFDMHHI